MLLLFVFRALSRISRPRRRNALRVPRVFLRPPAADRQARQGGKQRWFAGRAAFLHLDAEFSSVVLGSLDIALRKEPPWLRRASSCPAVE